MKRHHAYHSGDPHKIGLWEHPEGHWVQHSEALEAVDKAYAQAIRHAITEVEFQAEDKGWIDAREMIGALEVLAEQHKAKP
jgi:RNA:NAD 2'-phosphotransferase (TPT1/KptA family)